MEKLDSLPPCIQDTHRSLRPYLKQRRETETIRKVLAAHLGSCLTSKAELSIDRPLSLVECTANVEAGTTGLRGIRREYLRSIRANVKAKKEYQAIIAENQFRTSLERELPKEVTRNKIGLVVKSEPALQPFLNTVVCRRKHDRLRIIQDYADTLVQKPAADINNFEPTVVLKGLDAPPQVPQEVLDTLGASTLRRKTDLKELIDQLEKSILRAKLLLGKEQKLLSKIRYNISSNDTGSMNDACKLQALGTTRNELIAWIESELGKASDVSDDSNNGQDIAPHGGNEEGEFERQLSAVEEKYTQYLKSRSKLLLAVNGRTHSRDADISPNESKENKEQTATTFPALMSHPIHPYLEELASISNEQKSHIQQRSHLTARFAKIARTSSQGLDLLADESHLIPAHPALSIDKHQKGRASFAEETFTKSGSSSNQRAKDWVFASCSADETTAEAVSENLAEGQMLTTDTRENLRALQEFFGVKSMQENRRGVMDEAGRKDIWAALEGHLGVIKGADW
ncbi:hypothetical protein B0O99DRAFT_604572 [Bisporella sp. PMI_857]|nr:hypothetical protein B0O99DRAFT_604572 [Bisporella sp. PMI_857]